MDVRVEQKLDQILERLRSLELELNTLNANYAHTVRRVEAIEPAVEDARFAKRAVLALGAGLPGLFSVLKAVGVV